MNQLRALTGGDIDLYWEYTGTGWISYLKNTKPIGDPQKQLDAVVKADAKNGITWWDRATANNTYALAQTQATLAKYGVKTLSECGACQEEPGRCLDLRRERVQEPRRRFPRGGEDLRLNLPGKYDNLLDTAVVYTALHKGGTCNFGEVYETDGRVASLKLNLLQDDKQFFPNYNPAISIRSDVAKKYPQLEALFKPIADKLTTATLSALNKKVSVDGKKPRAVAQEWMRSEGFIK